MGVLLIVLAVISLIVAAVSFFGMKSSQKKKLEMGACEQRKISEVTSIIKETSDALGTDQGVEDKVSVIGNVECEHPLTSPLGNVPCVYYSMKVSIQEQERYEEKDENGVMQTKYRTQTRILNSSTQSTRFTIKDETGSILVDPTDADIQGLRKSVDKQEAVQVNNNNNAPVINLNFGSFSLNLTSNDSYNPYGNNGMNMSMNNNMSMMPQNNMSMNNNMCSNNMSMNNNMSMMPQNNMSMMPQNNMSMMPQNNNYYNPANKPEYVKYEEEILPLDAPLTVIGTACMEMGKPKMASKTKQKLVISTKSLDNMMTELNDSIKSSDKMWKAAGIIGIVLLVLGIIFS